MLKKSDMEKYNANTLTLTSVVLVYIYVCVCQTLHTHLSVTVGEYESPFKVLQYLVLLLVFADSEQSPEVAGLLGLHS